MDRKDDTQPDNHLNPAAAPAEPPQEAAGPDDIAPDEAPLDGHWLKTNGPSLVIGAAIIGLLCWYFDGVALLKMAIGLGFIIFIHELGHFLVAKWCDVHVTTFSIGFGPALPFCSWTWGETTYKLAVFPMGGYVQMVGQVDGDEAADANDDDPRSYKNKPVWQRMAIISAGVTMNAIFACVAFTVIFLGPGKPRPAAVVAAVESGKPAFTHNLRTGAEILRVNDIEHPNFDDLRYETVFSMGKIEIVAQRLGIDKEPLKYDITPHGGSMRLIGIQPAVRLQLVSKKRLPPDFTAPVITDSAAAKADKPFEFDDVIVGVTDPDFPDDKAKMLLPVDPRNPDGHLKDFFEFQRRMTVLAGKEVTLMVERGPVGGKKETVFIKVQPMFHKTLGTRMKMGQIVVVREKSAAADPKTGVLTPRTAESGQKLEGDVIKKVEVTEPDGKVTVFEEGTTLDPVRLPAQLKQWADRLWAARSNNPPLEQRKVTLHVKRHNDKNAAPAFLPTEKVELVWDREWRFDRVLAMSLTSPEAIPELGLAYEVKNQVDSLTGTAATSQLQNDDEIVDIGFMAFKPDRTTKDEGWIGKKLKGTEWANLFAIMQSPSLAKVKVKVKRNGEEKEFELEPQTDATWPLDERGLYLDLDMRVEKADNALQAIQMGFRDTYRQILQVYMGLRGFIAGTISVENVGGPVMIATTAYKVAQMDFWEFVFFLGFISVNLAVINFLPIPVLDGGHMVFLLYEKFRGKPASEGVRVGATYAGLLLLGCLMIFVIFLDIRRLVSG